MIPSSCGKSYYTKGSGVKDGANYTKPVHKKSSKSYRTYTQMNMMGSRQHSGRRSYHSPGENAKKGAETVGENKKSGHYEVMRLSSKYGTGDSGRRFGNNNNAYTYDDISSGRGSSSSAGSSRSGYSAYTSSCKSKPFIPHIPNTQHQ